MNEAVRYISQETIEKTYGRQFIDEKIREEMTASEDIQQKIELGVSMLNAWLNGSYYPKKQQRVDQIKQLDIHKLVTDIFVGISYFLHPELFTSVTGQLAGRLGWDDKLESITAIAEIIGVLCHTDAFNIAKPDRYASLEIESWMPLSEQLVDYIEHSAYLPPMVCEPRELTNNRSGAYLTFNDSVILGSGNHHEGEVCLDVLNTLNRNQLQLNTEFLSKYEEVPTHKLITPQQIDQWKRFKKQSYFFYTLMVDRGNCFHLTHKYDKRGRIYACAYHINTMGTSFKKASIDLYKEEVVIGSFD